MVMRVQRVIYFHAPGEFCKCRFFCKFPCSDAQVTSKAILLMRSLRSVTIAITEKLAPSFFSCIKSSQV